MNDISCSICHSLIISWSFLSHFLIISWSFLDRFLVISWSFLGHFLVISWSMLNLKNCFLNIICSHLCAKNILYSQEFVMNIIYSRLISLDLFAHKKLNFITIHVCIVWVDLMSGWPFVRSTLCRVDLLFHKTSTRHNVDLTKGRPPT